MERMMKWVLLALIAAEVILVRMGLLDLRTAVGVVIGIELLLMLVAGRQIIVAVRRYRRDRAAGLDLWAALEDGLAVLLPRPVARMAAMEPRLWSCMWKWLFRRRPPGEGEFGYHRRSMIRALLVVVVLTTPAELVLVHLLAPWDWLRWLLIVLAIYLLFWAFALCASLVVMPHRLDASGLRLHYGVLNGGYLPYSSIERVELDRRRAPGVDGLQMVAKENTAYLAINGRTDLSLRLRTPLPLEGVLGPTTPVEVVRLAADEPQRLFQELNRRLARFVPESPDSETVRFSEGGGG